MQLSSTITPSILPGGCYDTNPAPTNTGPIGVTSFGTLRIGHALNGVVYSDHQLLAPLVAPTAHFSGSLNDAIEGAQQLLAGQEATGASYRGVIALTGVGTEWDAHILSPDADVLRAVDFGAGTGGIASLEFTSMSRSFGALVSSKGVQTAHPRIAE
jgi:hypothetical protein